jgi:hypothetical protein
MFLGSDLQPVSRHILDSCIASSIETGGAAIVLDDAMYSGGTIFKMLDLADASNSQFVAVYALLRRGTDNLTNRIKKIKKYGHATIAVREIASIEMPVYLSSECPHCQRLRDLEDIAKTLKEDGLLWKAVAKEVAALKLVDAQIACREDAGWVDSDLANNADRIRLRWVLQLASHSTGNKYREQLLDIVNTCGRVLEKSEWALNANELDVVRLALTLFRCFANERHQLLYNASVRLHALTENFEKATIPVLSVLLKGIHKLADRDAEGVLAVYAAIDPFGYLERLPVLLKDNLGNPQIIWFVLRECYFAPEVRRLQSRVLAAISSARTPADQATTEMLDDALQIWLRRSDRSSPTSSPIVEFTRLTGPQVHDLGKFIEKIIADLQTNQDWLMDDWQRVLVPLTTFLADINIFKRGLGDHADVANELWERVFEFEYNFSKATAVVDAINAGGRRSINQQTKEGVVHWLQRMKELIQSRGRVEGIRPSIEGFRSEVLQMVDHATSDLGLTVIWERVIDGGWVFCHTFHLYRVIRNVLENAVNAGAKRLKVQIDRGSSNTITIALLDDGRGIVAGTPFSQGLGIVENILTIYGGTFQLIPLDDEGSPDCDGFRTKAFINLASAPIRREAEEALS